MLLLVLQLKELEFEDFVVQEVLKIIRTMRMLILTHPDVSLQLSNISFFYLVDLVITELLEIKFLFGYVFFKSIIQVVELGYYLFLDQ